MSENRTRSELADLYLKVLCVSAFIFSVSFANAQAHQGTRQFVLDGKRSNDPIQLVGFRVGGVLVAPDAQFEATATDWLRDSSMVLKNVSKKQIVAIWIMLSFPESGESLPPVADQIRFGNPPIEGIYSANGEKLSLTPEPILSLMSNQTIEVSLGQHYLGYSKLISKRKAVEGLSVCRVRFANVYFIDGMKWSPNYFGKPDPENLGKYIQIRPSEFYEYRPAKSEEK